MSDSSGRTVRFRWFFGGLFALACIAVAVGLFPLRAMRLPTGIEFPRASAQTVGSVAVEANRGSEPLVQIELESNLSGLPDLSAAVSASSRLGQADLTAIAPRVVVDTHFAQVAVDENSRATVESVGDPATVDKGSESSEEETESEPYQLHELKLPEPRFDRPSARDRQVTLVVAQLLRREHLLNDPLDDEHSRRGLQNYLKSLDPMKVYFYQSDIARFLEYQDELDDRLKRGDIQLAYTIFSIFLERIGERVRDIDILLSEEQDFSVEEQIITDRDAAHYPKDSAEALERWRRRIKYDLLNLKADETTGHEARKRLWRRYSSFAKRMCQTESDELLEMYLTALTTGYDPHTTFMSASTLDNFHIALRLHLEGIGAALHVVDGYTVVSKIIPGGAADKSGDLKPEDRIVSVGQGEDGELTDVVDMKLGDVVKLIRGPAGTIVRLGVNPAGVGEKQIYIITRAKIELKDSEARSVVFEDEEKPDGTPFRIGVIDLPSFYMDMSRSKPDAPELRKSTTRDVKKIIDEFKKQQLDGVILDLRRNGGGSLTEAIQLTGLFIDRGPVVQVKDSAGNIQHYDDLESGMAWDGPLVVLTSKFSASASEILAGAVQDYRRGLVIGDSSTHGKGTVQSLLDLGTQLFRRIPNPPKLGALKITMQQFYRPLGDSTQKVGVLSDVVLPSLTDQLDIAESDLPFALEQDHVPALDFSRLSMVNNGLVNELRQRSITRRESSDDFKKVHEKIARYIEQKEKKSVSLVEEKFFARLSEFDAEKEEEKQLEDETDPDQPIVERDFYFEEVLDITVDYIKLLEDSRVVNAN